MRTKLWQIQSGPNSVGSALQGVFTYINPQPSSLDQLCGYVTQLGSPVGTILPSPPTAVVGGDIPFYWQWITAAEHTPQAAIRRLRHLHSAIHPEDFMFRWHLNFATAPIDTSLLFFSGNDSNDLVPAQAQARRRRNQALEAGLSQENVRGIFIDFINGAQFNTDSCALLEEIQRHLLEPVIDQGASWTLWTQAEVLGFLNLRLQRFMIETGLIRKEALVTAGSGNLPYPTDLLEARRLGFGVSSAFPTSGIVSYWKLDETSGSRMDSVVATANTLTDVNATPSGPGKIDNAAFFTEASFQTLTHDSTPSLQTGDIDFTFSCWVKLRNGAFGGRRALISKGVIFAGDEYFLCYNKGTDRFTFHVNASAELTATSGGSPGFDIWHFIVAWHDSVANTINIQVDNGVVDSVAYAGGGTTNTQAFRLGSTSDNARYLNGFLDEVAFYKRVLSPPDRTTLWNSSDGLTYPAQPVQITSTLERMDQSASDNAFIDWENTTGEPIAFVEEPKNSGTFQLLPPPASQGVVDVLYVPLPSQVTAVCAPLPFPNFFSNFIKWGVIADMLSKEGEANDPQRAAAAAARWQEGIELAKTMLGTP